MCGVLKVHPSGFYRWMEEPESPRSIENRKITELIRFYWEESGCVYGRPTIHKDLKEAGYTIGENRIVRLMRKAGIKGAHRRKQEKIFSILLSVFIIR